MQSRSGPQAATLQIVARLICVLLGLSGALLCPRPALACSQSYGPTDLRPGTAVFTEEGLWFLALGGVWMRLSSDGQVRRAPRTGSSSRVARNGRAIVTLESGMVTSECSVGWISLSYLDLEAGVRVGSERLGEERMSGGQDQDGWMWGARSMAVSPSGRHVVLMGRGAVFLEFPRRLFSSEIAVVGAAVWLDDQRVAVYGEGRLSLVRPSGQVTPLMEVELDRLLAEGASPEHLLAVERGEERHTWRFVDIDLTTSPPTLSRASWVGEGERLGLSGSGDQVAVLKDGEVRVLDRQSGERLAVVRSPRNIVDASLSEHGARLSVSSRRDPLPAPEDMQNGEEDLLWERGEGPLTLEVFSLRDGSRLQSWGGTAESRLEIDGAALP